MGNAEIESSQKVAELVNSTHLARPRQQQGLLPGTRHWIKGARCERDDSPDSRGCAPE